jgi:phosphotransferase system enzyme I (PtsI)
MNSIVEGVGASAGRALGVVRWIHWDITVVPHRTIGPEEVEAEVRRFDEARAWALEQVTRLQEETTRRLGPFEGKVFESQAMMIEDPELIAGTVAYIRNNFLSAERAFDWQMLEVRVRMHDSVHAMVLDRLADLRDIRIRVLCHLLDRTEPARAAANGTEPAILVAHDITPSIAAGLDPEQTLGIVTAGGSRGSHSVLLARALGIPAVVGVGAELKEIADGSLLLMDGRTGELRLDPSPPEVEGFHRAAAHAARRREMLRKVSGRPTETTDGVHTVVQANLDLPHEAEEAVRLGADGVGLFRSEFLVIGRREIPDEEEQFRAYKRVVEAFPDQEVTLRTFDIGGDKFPIFLSMPQEDNPYLGWRAIRVCLDLPDLFRNQLRAAVRAAEVGNIRVLLPLVSTVDEVRNTRDILHQIYETLESAEKGRRILVGVMVETPAAVETLDLLAPYVDFVSLGTNDLTQYVMAADRGNAKLARLYDPMHPALIRLYARLERDCARHELDLGVCGELASDPLGVSLLLGMGYRKFSVSLAALPEIRELIRNVSAADLHDVCRGLYKAESGAEVREPIQRYLESRAGFGSDFAAALSEE